jgi:hypothetical protein
MLSGGFFIGWAGGTASLSPQLVDFQFSATYPTGNLENHRPGGFSLRRYIEFFAVLYRFDEKENPVWSLRVNKRGEQTGSDTNTSSHLFISPCVL